LTPHRIEMLTVQEAFTCLPIIYSTPYASHSFTFYSSASVP
jgi:hypothetical protein